MILEGYERIARFYHRNSLDWRKITQQIPISYDKYMLCGREIRFAGQIWKEFVN